MNIENFNYFFPKKEIIDWQNGEKLSDELKQHEITFVKRIGDHVVTSKTSKVHISLFEKYKKEYFDSLSTMKNGDTKFTKSSLIFHKKDDKILVKHICHVMTLDNILMVLNND